MRVVQVFLLLCNCLIPSMANAQIVNPTEVYTYDSYTEDITELSERYPDLITIKSIGTTPFGRKVLALKLGNGKKTILLHGAHHAREWMTSTLLMKMVETYAQSYQNQQPVDGFTPAILDQVSIWFVPMLNPDGVTLQQFGLTAFPEYMHAGFIDMNDGSLNFNRWKSNLNGIDLNRQYPANWDDLKGIAPKPSYQFYKGNYPLEAEEIQALFHFTYEVNPEIAVAYHSTGNVLFWGYHLWGITHTTDFADDIYEIAQPLSSLTKYELEEPSSQQQGGGYTDWFVQEFDKPGVTIEIGPLTKDNSLPLDTFPDIWKRNKAVGLFLAEKALER